MRRILAAMPTLLLCACARPFLAQDGTLVFQQAGAHGAAVVTANGVEFHDVTDVPKRVVVRDPYEPWRAPVGFIVPANLRFTKTSTSTVLATSGLVVSLRPSDTRVPSWGGEMLVRIDVSAPATEKATRWGEDVAIVLDGRGPDSRALCEAALGQLGARDRVVVVDSAGARVVVPIMPASHRSLILAAIDRHLGEPEGAARDRAAAVRTALGVMSAAIYRRVLVVSDAEDAAREEAERGLGDAFVPLAVIASTPARSELDMRAGEVKDFVPPAGEPAFHDVVVAFDGTPAPSHVLEASGGDARWELEGGELALGDVRTGDARAEVVRVTIPAWQSGDPFTLHVAVRFGDVAGGLAERTVTADLHCIYDDDIERIAQSRNGDVIAYASALATLARFDKAFTGGFDTSADLRRIAQMHVRSLSLLARDRHDPAAADQAALLEALLAATN